MSAETLGAFLDGVAALQTDEPPKVPAEPRQTRRVFTSILMDMSRRNPVPDHSYLKSASALSIALGLAATPLAAQPADTPAGLLKTYPALSAIGDRSCLNTLAEYEAEAGSGALESVVEGEIAPEAVEDADEELLRCLQVAADAGADGSEAPAIAAAVPEDVEDPDGDEADEAESAAPDTETAVTDPPETDAPQDPAAEAAEDPQAPDEGPEPPPMAEDTAEADAEPMEEEAEVTAAPEAADEETAAAEPVEGSDEAETRAEAEAAPEPDAMEERDAAAESGTESPAEAEPETAEAPESAEEAPAGDDAVAEGTVEPEGTTPKKEQVTETMPGAAETETAETSQDAQTGEDSLAEALAETAEPEPAANETTSEGTSEAAAGEASPAAEDGQEAVQEDTAALAEAVNEAVTAVAAATEEAAEAEEVETTVVTEETARSSDEEFAATATQDSGGGGINFGQVAAGVLGGILLNELLGANEEVVANTGDRVVVQRGDGDYYVLKDENALLRRPGNEVETYRYSDGSTRQVVTREDGTQVITVRAADGRPLRRVRVLPDGRRVVLFDDTDRIEPVDLDDLPPARAEYVEFTGDMDSEALRQALAVEEADIADRRFSLRQVRDLRAVRSLVPTLQLETINFETGSAAISASQAEALAEIGNAMRRMIDENPLEVFLIEGHTDAVGPAAYNLALSDRRAESVALALTEYFDVPPENMVVQGYGESNLRVPTTEAERRNRRAAVRRITPLLNSASLQ